jgi:dihydroxyacetone kinase-like protein
VSTTLRETILAAADAVEAAQYELGVLDSVAGDGDHGVTMAILARNVRKKLAEAPDATGADLVGLVALGSASVGGATGPLFGTGLMRIAAEMRAVGPTVEISIAYLQRCLEAAEDGIVALGNAKPGDKTIVDGIHPAVEALRRAEADGSDVGDAVRAAAAAAREGADSTAGMIARIGRASRLGERSRGSADPGATSFAIITEALAAAYLSVVRGDR